MNQTTTITPEMLTSHHLWFAGQGGERLNLRDAKLRGANLSGANLSGADLRGANLRDAKGVLAVWQGGTIGPRRRMQTLIIDEAMGVTMHQGCITASSVEDLETILRKTRADDWAAELGGDEQAETEILSAVEHATLGLTTALRHAHAEQARRDAR